MFRQTVVTKCIFLVWVWEKYWRPRRKPEPVSSTEIRLRHGFVLCQHFSSRNVSNLGTFVSKGERRGTHLIDPSSSVHSHVFQCLRSCFGMNYSGIGTRGSSLTSRRGSSLTSRRGEDLLPGVVWCGQSSSTLVDRRVRGSDGEGVIFTLGESHLEKDSAFQDLFI